ncbi:carbohydrate kinase [Clostridiales bacterium]|nr:carbohydrate kinase [Clostridiales bacterium]
MKNEVAALGELLIDFATQHTDDKGYPTMKANPGGAPANFLAALSKYGRSTGFIGKVGDDTFGKLLIGTLESANIDTRGIVMDQECYTTLAFVTFDDQGNRSFSFARKPGADTRLRWEEVDTEMIDECRVFHFGTLSLTDEPARGATREAVAYARKAGKLVSFDPNLRLPLWKTPETAKKQILWGLGQADVVKISDEEVEFLWGCDPAQGMERLLHEFDLSLVMVTLGPKGCFIGNQNGTAMVSPPPVEPVDTTGAGDIFGGSAMSRLLSADKRPDQLTVLEMEGVARFAVAAASLSTQKLGGIPSIPEEQEVWDLIDSQSAKDSGV